LLDDLGAGEVRLIMVFALVKAGEGLIERLGLNVPDLVVTASMQLSDGDFVWCGS